MHARHQGQARLRSIITSAAYQMAHAMHKHTKRSRQCHTGRVQRCPGHSPVHQHMLLADRNKAAAVLLHAQPTCLHTALTTASAPVSKAGTSASEVGVHNTCFTPLKPFSSTTAAHSPHYLATKHPFQLSTPATPATRCKHVITHVITNVTSSCRRAPCCPAPAPHPGSRCNAPGSSHPARTLRPRGSASACSRPPQ